MESQRSDEIYREELLNVGNFIKFRAKKVCRQKTITTKLPILKWLPKYTLKDLINDFVAGLTVGLTAIPQGIAYGVVAGLEPQYGLYSAFVGCFVYIVFGTCKDVTIGPTAIMALMVQKYVSDSADYAILLCFLSGCIITLCGFLKLGFLVQFISTPVTVGFTAAAAITIGSGQINPLVGIKSPSNEFIDAWIHFFTHFKKIQLYDALLGISTLLFLIAFRKLKDVQGKLRPIAQFLSLSRNAIAVIFGIILAHALRDHEPFSICGEIKSGLPNFGLPPFTTTVNGTVIQFPEVVRHLGSSIVAIPVIAIVESIAIAKAFAKGKTVNASQEMIAVGLSNALGSFFQSMPVTGSFTRTAVNNASGVRTPMGGAVTGSLVILALAVLTGTFYYIPKAVLAAIIISAMIFMLEFDKMLEIWRAKKIDIIPFFITLLVSLYFGLEYGMLSGVLASVLFILYKSATPNVEVTVEKMNEYEYVVIGLRDSLMFSCADYLKSKICELVDENKAKLMLINGEGFDYIDSTTAMAILSLKQDLELLNCELILWNWSNKTAGVLYRINPLNKKLLRYGKTADIAIRQHLQEKQTQISIAKP